MPRAIPKTKKAKAAKTHKVMREFKRDELHSGSQDGPVVTSRKQAVAIALAESGQTKPKQKKRKS